MGHVIPLHRHVQASQRSSGYVGPAVQFTKSDVGAIRKFMVLMDAMTGTSPDARDQITSVLRLHRRSGIAVPADEKSHALYFDGAVSQSVVAETILSVIENRLNRPNRKGAVGISAVLDPSTMQLKLADVHL